MCSQRTKWLRNIAENFNRLSRAHERFTEDRQTTDRRMFAKIVIFRFIITYCIHLLSISSDLLVFHVLYDRRLCRVAVFALCPR